MDIQGIHSILLERFGPAAVGSEPHQAKDPWIQVAPSSIVTVCTFLRDDSRMQFNHLNDLCGVDYLEPDPKKAAKFGHEPHLEVVYHLSSLGLNHRLKLKVVLPRWRDNVAGQLPVVPSVSSVWGIANWHEREAYDLMGIEFEGHPNLRRSLCPEDWVEYHGVRGR
jgi:NADH-quinone oxidoreductase subunit C